MTMRTYRYFICPNGHRGEEKTLENDQPYSASWEEIRVTGMEELGNDTYICLECGEVMIETKV